MPAPIVGRTGRRPVIAVTACIKPVEGSPFHAAGMKYVEAAAEGAGGMPLIVPALGDGIDIDQLLGMVDGILVTGSTSNVDPALYGGPAPRPGNKSDAARDATTLPLIRAAIDRDLPLLAICRGHQELNVALGGTLHQHVHEVPGMMDHRDDGTRPWEDRFGHAHPVTAVAGGMLQRILGGRQAIMVNSLHHQAIDRLAPSLVVEATAADGVVEAASLPGRRFVLGVQWHPEALWRIDGDHAAILQAFGEAAAERAVSRSTAA